MSSVSFKSDCVQRQRLPPRTGKSRADAIFGAPISAIFKTARTFDAFGVLFDARSSARRYDRRNRFRFFAERRRA
jgi:hypothetical protein